MKSFILIAVFILSGIVSAQDTSNSDAEPKLRDLGISITVDSAEEISEAIKFKDIKSLAKMTDGNQDITFELKCRQKSETPNTEKFVSYKVEGKTDNVEGFLFMVKRIKKAAINHYKNAE